MKLKAPAKLNLFLFILGRRPDGYHELRTLFQKITLTDELELKKATDVTLEVEGEAPSGQENLAWRAAQAFLEKAPLKAGVFIRLRKGIPPGTGLGGASSDAAAVLKGLAQLYPGCLTSQDLWEIGRSLGADVPFFLSPYSAALGEGIGERLSPWSVPPAWYLVMVPPFRISTSWAYQNLRLTKGKSSFIERPEDFSWERGLVNDFKPLVWGRYPELKEVETYLKGLGALGVGLSGSGSALFGVFKTQEEAEEAQRRLPARFKGYQTFVATQYQEGDLCL